jgi:hypothetical protein
MAKKKRNEPQQPQTLEPGPEIPFGEADDVQGPPDPVFPKTITISPMENPAAPALPAVQPFEPDVAGTPATLLEIAPNQWINPLQVVQARAIGGHFRVWLSDGREQMIDAQHERAVRRRLGAL